MTGAIGVDEARRALAALPHETRYGEIPSPADVYLPRSHVKALDLDTLLVTGMRGTGKTFWWSALQEPTVRRLISGAGARRGLSEDTEVRIGFGVKSSPDDYPSRDELRKLLAAGVEPRTVWRAVQACHMAPDGHPLRRPNTWADRAAWVDASPEVVERLFLDRDAELDRVRLFFVEEFSPYSWAFLPADASLQCSFRGDSNQASAYPRLSGGQPSLETVPNTVGLSPSGALPSGHSRGVLVRCRGKGGRPAMAVTTGFQGRTFDVARTGVPCIDLPSPAPCAAADAVFADAKAFLSSSEARQMSESELERELHRRRQDLVRKLLQGHRDQRSPKEAAGPAEDTGGVECSEPREHESHAETTSGTMQVVGLGCARRGHDGLHRLDAALNLLPERYLVEMRRRVTIATASRAPPRTPWKPQWYSTSSTWQRRRGVRCSSSARRRACRHLVRDPMGVDRRTVTFGCSCGGSQPPQAAGALMRTETSHEAREDQRKSPIGR